MLSRCVVDRWWHDALFQEPNPNRSRQSDVIGHCKQRTPKYPHKPSTEGMEECDRRGARAGRVM